MSAPTNRPVTQTTSAPSGSSTVTRTEVVSGAQQPDAPTLRLTLSTTTAATNRRVSWNAETIDNEHMAKKKSKCCCIYKKPLQFGESSSESDDDECDNCYGHVEKKKKNKKRLPPDGSNPDERDEHGHDHHHHDDDHQQQPPSGHAGSVSAN